MGAGCHVTAYDVSFNRGVLGENGRFFENESAIPGVLAEVEAELAQDLAAHESRAQGLQDRAAEVYQWDAVAADYHRLAVRLDNGELRRPHYSGRRRS